MTGPEDEITSIDKRDGSHWEIVDCDNSVGEERQTVKLVCTDTSEDNNCNVLFKGEVRHTIVDMPDHCGPGRYAVVQDLKVSVDHEHLMHRLVKRGLESAPVYDLTFDYDFGLFEKRGDASNVQVRIDYSDDPGYWSEIVAAHHDKAKRDLEVEQDFDGDHKAWLYHTWNKEKRSITHKELQARWWSGNVREWFDKQRQEDMTYTGIRHRVTDSFTVPFFDETLKCPDWLGVEMKFRAWADLTFDLDTAGGVTVIGNVGNVQSFKESSACLRTRGRVDAGLHFRARGTLSFHSGPVESFGAQNFGANFRVPGFVTIGPNFRIIGSLTGDATLQMKADYAVNFAKWDYSMEFPVPSGVDDTPKAEDAMTEPQVNTTNSNPTTDEDGLSWLVDAKGSLVVHIISKVTFGIVFDSSKVSDAALEIGVDAYTRLLADAKVGSWQNFVYCYSADGGATLLADVEAPTFFGSPYSKNWPLWAKKFDIIPRICSDGSTDAKVKVRALDAGF